VPRYTVVESPGPATGLAGVRLCDSVTGAEAQIASSAGANPVELRLAVRGTTHDVLVPVPAPGSPTRGFGAPVLFPFPNRLRHGRYTWDGAVHQVPVSASGHAIHGLVRDQAFTLASVQDGELAAALTCSISAADVAGAASAYPFDFMLELTYTLDHRGLRTQATVLNLGATPMPFGLGFHPYFRAPLGAGGRRADCRVQLWAPCVWETDGDLLPTGALVPVPDALDPRGYPALGDTALDTFFTRLALDDPGAGCWSSRLLDPTVGIEIVVVADAAFREAVIFAPPARSVVSIEPYTCVADALNLNDRGIDSGLLVLGPGDRWSAGYTISARAVSYATG
jgi:aldose 1-epimerase